MIVHKLLETREGVRTTHCGLRFKRDDPDGPTTTSWSSEVTCVDCLGGGADVGAKRRPEGPTPAMAVALPLES